MDQYETLYKEYGIFKTYVDKYAKKHELTTEEALKHKLVREVGDRYKTMEAREYDGGRKTVNTFGC